MPGLVGIVSTNGDRVNPSLTGAMRDAIRHRDWYKVDDYVNGRGTVTVSRVHLGIINRDRQPFSARSGRVQVFLHGEICNDAVAHSNPLEFIYRLYEKEGPDFACALNGSFVIVIVDEDEGAVFIANDRIAAKPCFYFHDGRALYFGPEMKSLLRVPSLERRLNLAAVADFLANGHFIRDHTLLEGLKTMDSATVLKVRLGGMAWHRYWRYEIEEDSADRGPQYYRETLVGLLRRSVRRRLQTDNTYGILLSGGYDSRAILGCYLEARPSQELHTISWGREEDIPDSDCAIAKTLAGKLGADHGFYRLSAEDVIAKFRDFVFLGEGLTDYPESYDVFHAIKERQRVDIVLRGDECFGYSQSLTVHDEHTMLRSLNLRALRYMPVYRRVLRPSWHKLLGELDAETTHHISATCNARNIHNRKDFFYLDVRLKHYLNPLNYAKNFAIESFNPLLDGEILDFVRAWPLRYRLGKSFYRQTVVETFPKLYETIARKRNDIDWAASFRSSPELQRFVYDELVEKPGMLDEYVNMDGLRSELDTFFLAPPGAVEANILGVLGRSPDAFRFVHACSYYVRKWMGRSRDLLPPEQLIIRLLILKAWGDIFLNFPAANLPG